MCVILLHFKDIQCTSFVDHTYIEYVITTQTAHKYPKDIHKMIIKDIKDIHRWSVLRSSDIQWTSVVYLFMKLVDML